MQLCTPFENISSQFFQTAGKPQSLQRTAAGKGLSSDRLNAPGQGQFPKRCAAPEGSGPDGFKGCGQRYLFQRFTAVEKLPGDGNHLRRQNSGTQLITVPEYTVSQICRMPRKTQSRYGTVVKSIAADGSESFGKVYAEQVKAASKSPRPYGTQFPGKRQAFQGGTAGKGLASYGGDLVRDLYALQTDAVPESPVRDLRQT